MILIRLFLAMLVCFGAMAMGGTWFHLSAVGCVFFGALCSVVFMVVTGKK